jgi:MFS family permease
MAMPSTPQARPTPPTSTFDARYANRALIVLSTLAALVVYIDVMLTPALPTIATEYGVSIAQTSLLISLYTVFGVAVMPIIGKLGDIYGKRRVLLCTLAVYLVVATTTSFAPTFSLVLVSRFFQGVGLGVFPLAFSMAREEFPRPLVPRAQGVISAVQVAGGAMGILVGSFVTGTYGWQANYHLALPFVLVMSVLVFLLVRESPNLKPGVRLDYAGAAGLGVCLTALVFGLSQGATWGWTSVPVLGLILGGAAGLVPLALFERRRPEPVFDLRLLRQRNVLISNLLALVFGVSIYIAFQAITYFAQLPAPRGLGLSIFQTGLELLPLVVVLLPVALAVGSIIPRYGVKPFLYLGSGLALTGFLLLTQATTPLELSAFLTIYAAGGGMLSVSIQNLLVLSLEKGVMGLGTSLNTSFRYMGQSLGAPIAGAVLTTLVSTVVISGHAELLPSRMAFQLCFFVAGIAFVFLALIAAFAREVAGPRKLDSTQGLPASPVQLKST